MNVSNIKVNKVVSIKLNSGEELVARVTEVSPDYNEITLIEPVSIAPSQNGLGFMPSLFTANPKGSFTLNTNSIAIIAETDDDIRAKYTEVTTGIKVPDKKIIMG